MRTLIKEYMVEKSRIGFIRFIFEAHEGVATVTTLDPKTGHIRLNIAPGRSQTVFRIIDDLKKDSKFHECQ